MNYSDEKLIIVLVGLPARGVTSVARHILRYLLWVGFKSKLYVKEDYEILVQQGKLELNVNINKQDITEDGCNLVEEVDIHILLELAEYMNLEGNISILDSDNISAKQRRFTKQFLDKHIKVPNYNVLFFEIINENEDKIKEVLLHYCSKSPFYKDLPLDEAVKKHLDKIKIKNSIYDHLSEEMDGSDCCFIRGWRHSSRLEAQNISKGYLLSKITAFVMNIKLDMKKIIYLVKHGESYNYSQKILGSDYGITDNGKNYSFGLLKYFQNQKEICKDKEFVIYSSCLKRTIETTKYLNSLGRNIQIKALDDIDIGLVDGIKIEELELKYEEELKERRKNKLYFRFDRGESYFDLICRLDKIVHDLERSSHCSVIVGHQSVLRCLYGYFKSIDIEKIPYIVIPDNCVIKIEDSLYDNVKETRDIIRINDNYEEDASYFK
jgi:broad specificity phosphatase PhoE